MKKRILFFLVIGQLISAQTLKFETLLQYKISIRALQIYKNKVYYVGTESKFGFVNLKNHQNKNQIKLSPENLQFRTLAQDKTNFYAILIRA